jgi:hypothetical protein
VNDVKELCEQALDGPEPPLRDATEILAMARHATRARDRRRVVYGLAAVTALAAGALIVPEVIVAAPRPAPPATVVSPPSPPVATVPLPPVEQAVDHMPHILGLLAQALPAGHSLMQIDRSGDSAWYADLADDSYVVISSVLVSSGTGTGALRVIIRGDRPGPPEDLCEPEISAGFAAPAGAQCWQTLIDGGPIWTITGEDESRGQVNAASRVLDGGYLTVVAQQAVDRDDPPPPLARAPFSVADLATLVADPAMLP